MLQDNKDCKITSLIGHSSERYIALYVNDVFVWKKKKANERNLQ